MNRIALILAGVVLIAPLIHAQPCKITGTVTDKNTGAPLIGANARLLGTSRGAATNIDGVFEIDSLEAGTHILGIYYVGFQPDTMYVFTESEETTMIDIGLQEDFVVYDIIRHHSLARVYEEPRYHIVLTSSDPIMKFYGAGSR